MLSEAQLSYAAAAIDCDGHITLVRKDRHRKDRSPVAYYQPTVGLGQVDRIIPAILSEWFGGNVYDLAGWNGNRPTFQWQCYSAVAYRVCEILAPHLLLKRRQAGILLEYEATVVRSPVRLSDDVIEERARLYSEMRGLNMGRSRGRTDWKPVAA